MKERIIERQEEAKELVRELLEKDFRCRNDDLWLTLKVWQEKQFIKIYIPYDKLGEMIMPETISRTRREVQNVEHKFLPTDPRVLIARRVKEEVLRGYYGENKIVREWEELRFRIK